MKKLVRHLLVGLALMLSTQHIQAQAFSGGGVVLKTNFVGNGTLLYLGGQGTRAFDSWYVGGAGYGLMNGKACCWNKDQSGPLGLGYGGFVFGYQRAISGDWSFHAQSLLGFGGGGFEDEGYSTFVFEPELGLSLKPTRVFWVQLGLTYMQTIPTSGPDVDRPSLNSFGLSLKLIFTSSPTDE